MPDEVDAQALSTLRAIDGQEVAACLAARRREGDRDYAGGHGARQRRQLQTRAREQARSGMAATGPRGRCVRHAAARQQRRQQNSFATIRDVQAAVFTARALGYRRIVLQGHSLGNIDGVVLLGAFANLPWKTRHVLVKDQVRFRALTEDVLVMMREGRPSDGFPSPCGRSTGMTRRSRRSMS